jgi:hypothetical protein
LILDEFALILHLEDVYWTEEGRVSVELAGLTAACIGFVMLGTSPLGVDDIGADELSIRLTLLTGLLIQAVLVVICLLKAKYRAALISCFLPVVAWVCAIRLARPNSWWARHLYRGRKRGRKREKRAIERAAKFDRRWDPKWRWVSDLIAGSPSEPDPPDIANQKAIEQESLATAERRLEATPSSGAPPHA